MFWPTKQVTLSKSIVPVGSKVQKLSGRPMKPVKSTLCLWNLWPGRGWTVSSRNKSININLPTWQAPCSSCLTVSWWTTSSTKSMNIPKWHQQNVRRLGKNSKTSTCQTVIILSQKPSTVVSSGTVKGTSLLAHSTTLTTPWPKSVPWQFWKRTQVDHDENAWEDYIRICDLGWTKSSCKWLKPQNLQSPFKEGALESTAKAALIG